MPSRLHRPCRYPACGRLTTDKSGYCEAHRGKEHKEYRQRRTDSKEQSFYGSQKWRQTSLDYRKAHPICEDCEEKPTRIVHHTPELPELLRRGLDPCDWRYLHGCCWGCHEKTKKGGH